MRDKKTVQVALGYGSLYNHSYKPNADYEDEAPAIQGPIEDAVLELLTGEGR